MNEGKGKREGVRLWRDLATKFVADEVSEVFYGIEKALFADFAPFFETSRSAVEFR